MYYDFCTELVKSELGFWKEKHLCLTFYTIVEIEHLKKRILFTRMQIVIIACLCHIQCHNILILLSSDV